MSGCRWVCVTLLTLNFGWAQEVTLTARVELQNADKADKSHESGNVLVWLVPASGVAKAAFQPTQKPRLDQRNKSFEPHVLVVPVGSVVAFPNHDPFFHNVFSLFEGKRFDLGLYEAGSARDVHFNKPGISYIFCNIHPEMSAAVVAVPTPYYAVTTADGSFQVRRVPPGRYKMEFWYELASEAELASLSQNLEVNAGSGPLALTLHSSDIAAQHLNKYGQEYPTEKPKSY